VGTALGLVLKKRGLAVAQICGRTKASSARARALIGAGEAVEQDALAPADFLMITTPDDALAAAARAAARAVKPGTIAFHCSGATPSSVLAPLKEKGALIAGVHPVKTFTDPARDSETFAGTWCGTEGDEGALAVLEKLLEQAGAHSFRVDPAKKTFYHAATIFMCSYIFPLIEAGLQCYGAAGVDRETGARVAASMSRTALENALTLGPGRTVTGPLSRGDAGVVEAQFRALLGWKPELGELYAALGRASVDLALEKGRASPENLEKIRRLLSEAA
jgi:predicted short-subunit dehydrogenase-like oxidoreductase (DUF2520 family)